MRICAHICICASICEHMRIYAVIYVYMRTYMHICDNIRIYALIYAYMRTCTHICEHICIYASMYAYMRSYICIYARIYGYMIGTLNIPRPPRPNGMVHYRSQYSHTPSPQSYGSQGFNIFCPAPHPPMVWSQLESLSFPLTLPSPLTLLSL